MACYYPITAYREVPLTSQGGAGRITMKRPLVEYTEIQLPCSTCIGCRLSKAREWAIRCTHEAQLHETNCFITLTFNPESLYKRKTPFLDKRDFQLFMKRLRKRYGAGIKYYHCGEYGTQFRRPHYHACLFGFDFRDKKPWKQEAGYTIYRSQSLEELWPFGYSTVTRFDFNTAAYVARYTQKKIYGRNAKDHYQTVDLTTGEILSIQPEYSTMSRRPGIGSQWLKKYIGEVYPIDRVVLKGKEMKPPKYYDRLFEASFPSDFNIVKERRKEKSDNLKLDKTRAEREYQLQAALAIQEQKQNNLKRSYENESTNVRNL